MVGFGLWVMHLIAYRAYNGRIYTPPAMPPGMCAMFIRVSVSASLGEIMRSMSMDPDPKIPEKRKVRARGGGSSSVNRISLILYNRPEWLMPSFYTKR